MYAGLFGLLEVGIGALSNPTFRQTLVVETNGAKSASGVARRTGFCAGSIRAKQAAEGFGFYVLLAHNVGSFEVRNMTFNVARDKWGYADEQVLLQLVTCHS